MSLLIAYETNRKWLKNCKNQKLLEKRIYVFRDLRVNVYLMKMLKSIVNKKVIVFFDNLGAENF